MNEFILVKNQEYIDEIQYINLANVSMIIPQRKWNKTKQYDVDIYFNDDSGKIEGIISFETAEKIYKNFQFEGEVINEDD